MYKDWNGDYLKHGIAAQRLYPNEALLQFMGGQGLLQKNNRKTILEIGCGSGTNLWMISKEGHDAYGIDISEEALRIAERHLREKWNVKATLRQGSFTEIPFDNKYFDYVVDIVSMQHIDMETSILALKEIKRVLKNDGIFFSYRLGEGSTPFFNGQRINRKKDAVTIENIDDKNLPLNNNGLISFWSSGIAHALYDKSGLKIEEIEKQTRTYQNGKYIIEYLAITARK